MGVFDAPVIGLAHMLGTSNDIAGFLLGLILILAVWFAATWVIGKDMYVTGIAAGIGVAVSCGFGWWPWWSGLLIMIIVLGVIIFSRNSASGSGF